MVDYEVLLEQVRSGEITEFVVNNADFPAFHKVWQGYSYQNQIRGEATRGGVVTYTRLETN
ncbi:hypothetical protein EQG49_09305 [Periweissella cryptocerci]|uniref:Uncharacterized protein n=1 Tax=Periweissella cryptocerci TaxID=2506420 RepID=A0A4P6YV87_9LACO|nr:hypothetical protein [Periweissella cryptocerci]QBO36653.1 hypothetical protein EQG49_09305 [Periweissella cryptocerci]